MKITRFTLVLVALIFSGCLVDDRVPTEPSIEPAPPDTSGAIWKKVQLYECVIDRPQTLADCPYPIVYTGEPLLIRSNVTHASEFYWVADSLYRYFVVSHLSWEKRDGFICSDSLDVRGRCFAEGLHGPFDPMVGNLFRGAGTIKIDNTGDYEINWEVVDRHPYPRLSLDTSFAIAVR